MKKIIYVVLSAVLLSSCTGVAPFSKAKYGHLKWIKKGATVEEKSNPVEPTANKVIQHTDQLSESENKQTQTVNYGIVSNEPVVAENNISVSNTAEIVSTIGPVNENTQKLDETSIKSKFIRSTAKSIQKPGMDSDVRMILAIIFAFLLPPVGVYLTRETSSPFVICLILCLLSAFIPFFWFFWGGGLLWLISAIIALLAVLQDV